MRTWVCAHVCSGRVFGDYACVCVRCALVCPACARAWRRRARDPAEVVRARRSVRPPAGAQHRLRPRACMRGVSERVGGRAGWAAQSSGGGAAVPRTPWHQAQPPGLAARRGGSWGRPAPPSPTAGCGPGGCGKGEEGRQEGPAKGRAEPRVLPPGCGPRGVATEGRGPRAGGRRPSRSPENKRRRRRLLCGQNNLRWRRPKAWPRPRSPSP